MVNESQEDKTMGKDKKDKKNKKRKENDLLKDSLRVVSGEELAASAKTHEKIAESDDQPEEKEIPGVRKIATKKAPAAIGPYSQVFIAGDFLFASGQIPADPETGEIVGTDVTVQAERVMKSIGKILKKAGTDYEHVVKTTCFLADMADFGAFNEVYAKYFTSKPARSCVAVKEIPKGVLCEVEVIAYVGDQK